MNHFLFFLIGLMILLRVQLIYISYSVGKLFSKLYTGRTVFMFILFFSVNAIGVLVRIWIEWGESSLMNDLTAMSIGIHLILVPTVIVRSYLKSN